MADNIYTSDDGGVVVNTEKLTIEQFNDVMEFRGCPVRVNLNSDATAAMLAAWDWLALKIEGLENGR